MNFPDELYRELGTVALRNKIERVEPRTLNDIVVGLVRRGLGGGARRGSGVIPSTNIPKPELPAGVGVLEEELGETVGRVAGEAFVSSLEIFDPETVFGKPPGTGGKSGKSRAGGKPMPEGLSTSQRAKWMRENGGGR